MALYSPCMGRGFFGFGRNVGEILPTSLLYSSGTLETSRKHYKPTFHYLKTKQSVIFPYIPFKWPYIAL